MKKYLALLMAVVLLLSLGTGVAAAHPQKTKGPLNFDVSKLVPYLPEDERKEPAPTATPKSTVFKTVTVPSVEDYISNMTPCDQMTMEEKFFSDAAMRDRRSRMGAA